MAKKKVITKVKKKPRGDIATRFQKGTAPGRPKGHPNRKPTLRGLLNDVFEKKYDKIQAILVKHMDKDSPDFKWAMGLLNSLEPRKVEHSGGIDLNINLTPEEKSGKVKRFKAYILEFND